MPVETAISKLPELLKIGEIPPSLIDISKMPPLPAVDISKVMESAEGSKRKKVIEKKYNAATCEVEVMSSLSLEDYEKEKIATPDDVRRMKSLAEALQGKSISFVNSTIEGGGVALMRGPMIHLMHLLGVDAHWYVVPPDDDKKVFKVTKRKFHNVFQGVQDKGEELTEEDEGVYNAWSARNAEKLRGQLSKSDAIVIEDPQPSGLIPFIKGSEGYEGINPKAKIIFRDHIQSLGKEMSTPGTPQKKSWDFVYRHNRVNEADLFVFHPVEDFIPDDVPRERSVLMPPCTDLLDDLNRPLTPEETERGLDVINQELSRNQGQSPIDLKRPIYTQIARFDPSKGINYVMECYRKLRGLMRDGNVKNEDIPQLVITGIGSVDDPDGDRILAETMARLNSEAYKDIKSDIKVARLPANPDNDIALNALLKKSKKALQLSEREGFEVKVTEALYNGVPVIGSDTGGIPLQIVHGESGFVEQVGDTDAVAKDMYKLLTDQEMYERMSANARRIAGEKNYDFTTVPNAINWMYLIDKVVNEPKYNFNRQKARDMVKRDMPDLPQRMDLAKAA